MNNYLFVRQNDVWYRVSEVGVVLELENSLLPLSVRTLAPSAGECIIHLDPAGFATLPALTAAHTALVQLVPKYVHATVDVISLKQVLSVEATAHRRMLREAQDASAHNKSIAERALREVQEYDTWMMLGAAACLGIGVILGAIIGAANSDTVEPLPSPEAVPPGTLIFYVLRDVAAGQTAAAA